MLINVRVAVAAGAVALVVAVSSPSLADKMTVTGKVVVYRTTDGIGEVTVTIKDAKSLDKIGDGKTSSDGGYSIDTDDSPDSISVTYDPPEDENYTPMGRTYITRASDEMGLDTVGLIDTDKSSGDDTENAYYNSGTAQYAQAGGDQARLVESLNWGMKMYPDFGGSLRNWQVKAFEQRGIKRSGEGLKFF